MSHQAKGSLSLSGRQFAATMLMLIFAEGIGLYGLNQGPYRFPFRPCQPQECKFLLHVSCRAYHLRRLLASISHKSSLSNRNAHSQTRVSCYLFIKLVAKFGFVSCIVFLNFDITNNLYDRCFSLPIKSSPPHENRDPGAQSGPLSPSRASSSILWPSPASQTAPSSCSCGPRPPHGPPCATSPPRPGCSGRAALRRVCRWRCCVRLGGGGSDGG